MISLFNKLFVIPLVYLLILIPVTSTTVGCSKSTQTQINTAVTNIETWAPVISTDATTLLTTIAQFNPSDAATIQLLVKQIQSDVSPLQALCAAYLANPSAGVLSQITSAVNAANTSTSSALFAALGIKDTTSLTIAKTALAAIATSLTVLTTYLSASGQPVSITLPKGFKFDKGVVTQAMNDGGIQNIMSSNVTMEQIVNELTKRGVVRFV